MYYVYSNCISNETESYSFQQHFQLSQEATLNRSMTWTVKTRIVTATIAYILVIKLTGFVQAQDEVFDCNDLDEVEGIDGLFSEIEESGKQNEITTFKCDDKEEVFGSLPEEFPSMPSLEFL